MPSVPRQRLAAFAAFGLVAVAMYVFGLVTDQFELRIATKAFPVLALIAWVGTRGEGRYARTILVGLVLCLVGDMLLEFRQRFFLFGMIAFLLGHVAYVVAFLQRTRGPAIVEALPFAAWIGWALWILGPGLGEMQIPVTAYTGVIFVMMWRATAAASVKPGLLAGAAMVGAVFFGFSDTLIALDRFHDPIGGVRIPIILTYWVAQTLIAASAIGGAAADDA